MWCHLETHEAWMPMRAKVECHLIHIWIQICVQVASVGIVEVNSKPHLLENIYAFSKNNILFDQQLTCI
jgi:hypothetical protein